VEISGAPGLPRGAFEHADVLWFQGRTRYADLRMPRPGGDPPARAEAFGGRQSWAAPRLRFHHELDLSGSLADDEGALAWEGETLLETGVWVFAGVRCAYRERWVRASLPGADLVVREARADDGGLRGLAVRIGTQELVLIAAAGSLVAEHRIAEGGDWRLVARLGAEADGCDRSRWACIEAGRCPDRPPGGELARTLRYPRAIDTP
jgi:hypothetical protein